MPDFQQLTATRNGTAAVTLPRVTISVQVTDSATGAVLHDFTGANALQWPAALASLTAAQHDKLLRMILAELVLMRAGLG